MHQINSDTCENPKLMIWTVSCEIPQKQNKAYDNAGDLGLIPGSGRSPGEENGNPFQSSCLGNSMDRGAWWATVHGVSKS